MANLSSRSDDLRASERRRSARHSFTAAADVMDPHTHLHISARTSDLDRQGCYIDTLNPFGAGTSIVLRVAKDNQSFSTMATVVYAQTGMGMGLIFDTLPIEQLRILDRWLGKSGKTLEPEPQVPTRVEAAVPVEHIATAPAAKHAEHPTSDRGAVAKPAEHPSADVLKYLVLMLMQKGILVELEGQALLERLLS